MNEREIMTNKKLWPRGEWDDEPDKAAWTDEMTGYSCLARRGPMGNWCGYVGIPQSHPWYGKKYSEKVKVPTDVRDRKISLDEVGPITLLCAALNHNPETFDEGYLEIAVAISVHGGITYSNLEGKLWWFGFDCGHHNDISPALIAILKMAGVGRDLYEGSTYRTLNYVKLECGHMAEQLKAFDTARICETTQEVKI